MKAALPVLLAAGGVYLLSRAWNTAQAVQKLEYVNPKIKIKNVTLLQTELEMSLDIKNPASASIYLDYFTGVINYQGSKISSFTFNANGKNIEIKSRTTTTVPFTLVISNAGAITTITKLIKAISSGGAISTVLNVEASLYAAGLDVPVKFSYDLKTNSIAGIGSVKATLEFSSNGGMEKYFGVRRATKKVKFTSN